jgi:arsenite methyltransferase
MRTLFLRVSILFLPTISSLSSLYVTTPMSLSTSAQTTHEQVAAYYGETLSSSSDLKTNACCTAVKPPPHILQALSHIHPTVVSKYYGCGLCIPDALSGLTVLDLGCGAGRDVYILSQLVGPTGRVHGVDMTPQQLAVAREYQSYHQEKFQYSESNVVFHEGFLERLDEVDIPDASIDLIVSNCVINLCTDKEAVFRHCHRLLKPGGEVYFSDVYSDRRIPEELKRDPVLYGECLSGALYWNDFHTLAKTCGFRDPRLVEDSLITIQNPQLEQTLVRMGGAKIQFYSATYRLFKLDGMLDASCEDYGQAVIYKGNMGPGLESGWMLDHHHYMETGKVFPVCGNTYNMLHETRFRPYFDFIGDFSRHYGIFEGCGTSIPYVSSKNRNSGTDASCGGGSCC